MAFIRFQHLRKGDNGSVIGGSASVIESVYVKGGKYHSAQEVRECLGKVVWVSDDRRSGIFISPTRGLVSYDARTDTFGEVGRDDSRVSGLGICADPPVHCVFGDSYLVLEFLRQSGMLSVLRGCFPAGKDLERVIAHIVHSVTRNGGRITCDNEVSRSFLSFIADDIPVRSLRSDTAYFSMMGEDSVRVGYAKAFVSLMREAEPGFGRACFIDSMPLPNSIDTPFNALCSHGLRGCEVQMRLVLVLDERTGLPFWYDIIPGNILDVSTVGRVTYDVRETLGIEIGSLILDAGYVSKDFLSSFALAQDTGGRMYIARMPARRGFPHKELYHEMKALFRNGKYAFRGDTGHSYFGHMKEVALFSGEVRAYAYVYVDQVNAALRFSEYLRSHEEEYEGMTSAEKSWRMVSDGYFVLLSNLRAEPSVILNSYFARTDIEAVFKTGKEYLDLLPLSKWSDRTVRGKILSDIISTTLLLLMRKRVNGGMEKKAKIPINEILGKTSALMCMRDGNGRVNVETPSKQVREYYQRLNIPVPSSIKAGAYKESIIYGKL